MGSAGRCSKLLLACGKSILTVAVAVFAAVELRSDASGAVPAAFVQETVASGFTAPVEVAFLPDGRMLVAELGGLVKLVGPTSTSTFLDLRTELSTFGERGLLGIAVDPQFQDNGYIYAYYVYEHDPANPMGPKTARLSRFVASGDAVSLSTEQVLLGSVSGDSCGTNLSADCIPSDFRDHHGGTIRFAADGTIFLSTGDGATVHGVTPNSLRAQNLDALAGKLLHVNRDGQGLAANPFWTGDASANRSKVWAYGFRNPFRFGLRPSDGMPYVGDVGWDTAEEIDVAAAGTNQGWPCYEGAPRQPGYEPEAICQSLYNQGPAAVAAPLVSYLHTTGASSVTGGVFYSGTQFPAEYRGAYFYADYVGGWIRYLTTDGSNGLVSGPTEFATAADGPVDIEVGSDGSLYYVAINVGEVRRIRYTPANRPPTTVAAATPTEGLAPLDVTFSSAGTVDPDGDPVSLDWNFGDGSPHASTASPLHRYGSNGTYVATLTADDGRGGTSASTTTVTVGNRSPSARIDAPSSDFQYVVGDHITLQGSSSDPDPGNVPTLGWVVQLKHCSVGGCHNHPFLSAAGPTLDFDAPDHGDDTSFLVRLTATDEGGLSTTVTSEILPRTVSLSLATSPSGLQLVYDGVTVDTPSTRTVVVGSLHQLRAPSPQGGNVFDHWDDTTDNVRQVIVTSNLALTATFATAPLSAGLPVVSGSAVVGQVLLGSVGSWSGTVPLSFGEQWLRCSVGADYSQSVLADGPLGYWRFEPLG